MVLNFGSYILEHNTEVTECHLLEKNTPDNSFDRKFIFYKTQPSPSRFFL